MPMQPANQRPGLGQGGNLNSCGTPPSTNELVILALLGALSFTHATLGEHSPRAAHCIFLEVD